MSNRLLHVFYDVDMRGRHEALAQVAKKEKIDIKNIRPGDMVCFINTAKDRIMVLAGVNEVDSFGVLGYYRSPHGRIDEMAIQHIPSAFNGGKFEMKKAIEKALVKRLAKKRAKLTLIPTKKIMNGNYASLN